MVLRRPFFNVLRIRIRFILDLRIHIRFILDLRIRIRFILDLWIRTVPYKIETDPKHSFFGWVNIYENTATFLLQAWINRLEQTGEEYDEF